MIILHEDSFEGLMCGLYWSYHYKTNQIQNEKYYERKLLDLTQYVVTDTTIASKMASRIRNRFGETTLEKILYAYLFGALDVGSVARTFLNYAVTVSGAIEDYSHEAVFPLLKLARAVERESHLMVGLLRFEQLESGVYYAKFEPTYDLLMILTPHFKKRLSDQSWVIHDTKRCKAMFYNTDESWLAPLEAIDYGLHQNEEDFQRLWQKYYHHIGIKERYNPKLRMNFMPKKYWNHLIEFKGKI